jgi:hypothetical protein
LSNPVLFVEGSGEHFALSASSQDLSPYAFLADTSASLTAVKMRVSSGPVRVKAVMIAIETNPAMSPYSIAVAPDSSFAKRFTTDFMMSSP